jgi:general secretion pathway protein D
LGALFRYKSVKKVKTNLLVFLRPVILRDEKAGMALTNSKYQYIRDLQLEQQEEGVSLLSDETSPTLPDIEGFLELPPPFEASRKPTESQLQYDVQKEQVEKFEAPEFE